MANIRDITGKNREFRGTDSITLPKGSQAQRVGGESGELRFNTDTNLAEYYDGTSWKPIDSPPTITSFTIDGGSSVTSSFIDRNAGGNASIVISGNNFDTTSAVVTFEPEGGSGSSIATQTITRTNASTFTVTVTRSDFTEAGDPYGIKLSNGSGLAATLASALDVNVAPTFATSADTNLGTVQNGHTATQYDSNLTTAAATDADGDTLTHTISAGSLPNGMSIEADGTFTGTASSLAASATVRTFTVQAATTNHTITRQFKITEIASAQVAATGGTVLTSGDYKTHIFTSPGTFAVSAAGAPSGSNSVEYMVVAGGAGGGGSHAGGGGAGGMRENFPSPATGGLSVSAQSYPITVGGGGAGRGPGPGASTSIIGGSGGTSVFSSITSAGGGGGAYSESGSRAGANGNPGGSGGGGGNGGNGGGTGNTPPVSPPQGNNGGGGYGSPIYPGGGGGGKGTAGQTSGGGPSPGGAAGVGEGIPTGFLGPTAPSYGTGGPSGSLRYFAGGGGGGVHSGNSHAGAPPAGGGGAGGTNANGNPGDNATANTGGGGGGSNGQSQTAGSGGSGIVAIRYKFQ